MYKIIDFHLIGYLYIFWKKLEKIYKYLIYSIFSNLFLLKLNEYDLN